MLYIYFVMVVRQIVTYAIVLELSKRMIIVIGKPYLDVSAKNDQQ